MKINATRLSAAVFAAFAFAAILQGCSTPHCQKDGCGEGWSSLFNGRNLDGWVQRGGKAAYRVEGDEIVGVSTTNTPNSFLCTARAYSDFILEYDFKVDERLNSGVQIRSECFDSEKTVEWQGKPVKIPANRVHGYQVEIDPDVKRGRMWSGGIYDEARRGWLFPAADDPAQQAAFSGQGRKIFKPGGWNHVRIEAAGDSISTWLNGVPCARIKDSLTPAGFIALQVHGIGREMDKNGTEVRWRNLRIKEIVTPQNVLTEAEKAAGWRLLWDGRSSAGWRGARSQAFPSHGWLMQGGELTVLASGGGEAAAGGDIITRDRFSRFELSVDFRITPGANSGIKYYCQPDLSPIDKVTGKPVAVGSAIGLEFQILDDSRHPDARLGRDGNRTIGSLYDLIPASPDKRPSPIGEWNTARIVSDGRHVEHWLNGVKVLEYDRDSAAFVQAVAISKYKDMTGFGSWADGHILLQDHGNRVSFRNIKVRVPESK